MILNRMILLILISSGCAYHNLTIGMFNTLSRYAFKKPGLGVLTQTMNLASFKEQPQSRSLHYVYNKDKTPLTKATFDKIDQEIIRPHQFPTALSNPHYNPEANETEVIQQKLDQKTDGKIEVKWIPDTLYNLVATENDPQYLSEHIPQYFKAFPQDPGEPDEAYFERITPSLKLYIRDFYNSVPVSWRTEVSLDKIERLMKNVVANEVRFYKKYPTKVLLYRGNGSNTDFDQKDAYEVGKCQSNATYCKIATNSCYTSHLDSIKKPSNRKLGPLCLSYGLNPLDNIHGIDPGGECPLNFALFPYKINPTEPDLYALPIDKKSVSKNSSLFYINPEYTTYETMFQSGQFFHSRAKGHIVENQKLPHNCLFQHPDPRIQTHESLEKVYQAYADLKKDQIQNAIGLTPYTQTAIENARAKFAKGRLERENSISAKLVSCFKAATNYMQNSTTKNDNHSPHKRSLSEE